MNRPQSRSKVNLGRGACPVVKMAKGGVVKMKKGGKICPEGKAWAKRTFDTYPSAYANLAASKYCKDPNYAKGAKGKKKKEESIMGELKKWLKQDWVRIGTDGKIKGKCGTSKDKKNPDRCLPRSKAQSLTKSQRAATAKKKKRAGAKGKTVVKNTKPATVNLGNGGFVRGKRYVKK